MDTVLGIKGKDFVLLAADGGTVRSIMRLNSDEDKLIQLDDAKVLGCAGPAADRAHFCEFVQRNMAFYRLRTGIDLSTKACANFVRNQLAEAIRKGPYQTNLLLAGYDKSTGASMYYMDYLASMQTITHGAHGYGAYFTMGLLDRYWHPNMSLEEAVGLIKKCIHELKERFIVGLPNFVLKVVDESGVRTINLRDFE